VAVFHASEKRWIVASSAISPLKGWSPAESNRARLVHAASKRRLAASGCGGIQTKAAVVRFSP
jgi:hypothetical protein